MTPFKPGPQGLSRRQLLKGLGVAPLLLRPSPSMDPRWLFDQPEAIPDRTPHSLSPTFV